MVDKKENKPKEKEEAAPGNKKPLFLIGGGVLLLLLVIGVGFGAYYLGSQKTAAPLPAAGADTAGEVAPAAAGPGNSPVGRAVTSAARIGPMVPIDDFIVNLIDRDANRYLKASITFEVDIEDTAAEINERMPQIRDAILLLVGNKTFDELRDLQGKMQLRSELAGQLNTILRKGQIRFIYFTNFVIQ